jgi:adenosylcobinamide-GDP ribazoletransferase
VTAPVVSSSESLQSSFPVRQWRAFVTAIQFLTRLPVSSRAADAQSLRGCPRYFPLIGGVIGLITVGLIWSMSWIWPAWLAVLMALTLELRLTGAMHEDALADCCDAFGGGWTRDRVLEIMKDSRLGTYGVLGLVSAVAIRAGATVQLLSSTGAGDVFRWATVLIASAAVGRWCLVLMMWLVPPIEQRESLSRDVGQQMTLSDLAVASLWVIPVTCLWTYLLPWQSLVGFILLAILIVWFRALVLRKLGGITGDCLGCIGYLGQLAVLLGSIAEWPV